MTTLQAATTDRLSALEIRSAAKKSGYSPSYVRQVINHGTGHEGTALRIARATGLPLKLLVHGRLGTETRSAEVAAEADGLCESRWEQDQRRSPGMAKCGATDG
jgi:hypothetical protein